MAIIPTWWLLPAITGHDVSGVVEAVGPGVTTFVPGDEVWYTPQIFEGPGSYAEYHVAAESIVGKKPPSLSHLGGGKPDAGWRDGVGSAVVRAALRVGRAFLYTAAREASVMSRSSWRKPWEQGCSQPCEKQTLSSHAAWGPM